MNYELREIKSSDLGIVCKILSNIGAKEFNNIDIPIGENVSQAELGTAIIFGIGSIIIENLPKTQKDIDTFLASLTGMKVVEIQNMNLGDYGELIFTVIKKEEFQDFFSHVWKLFNH